MKLKGRIVEMGLTQEYIAKKAGMNRTTFLRRIKAGGDGFTVGELRVIASLLSFTPEELLAFIMPQ